MYLHQVKKSVSGENQGRNIKKSLLNMEEDSAALSVANSLRVLGVGLNEM